MLVESDATRNLIGVKLATVSVPFVSTHTDKQRQTAGCQLHPNQVSRGIGLYQLLVKTSATFFCRFRAGISAQRKAEKDFPHLRPKLPKCRLLGCRPQSPTGKTSSKLHTDCNFVVYKSIFPFF